jgi:GNAT superfamily N-acetyltransferase
MRIGDDTNVSPPPILIRRASVDAPPAARLLAGYGAELVARGRLVSPLEQPAGQPPASWVEAHEMEPPGGAFLLAVEAGEPIACGGVRTLAPGLGEVKRMYVVPAARRRGIARLLLGELEQVASSLGQSRVRLDTSAVQPEALALYRTTGYVEIADYNGNPFATHWFQKDLASG